jgi:type I restriction enzyme M protein
VPPAGNANYAWVQHFIYHLAPTGHYRVRLANGSMSSNQRRRRDSQEHHRGRPGGLHGGSPASSSMATQIPACLWFLTRNKKNGPFRDRRGETLFIDARKLRGLYRPHPSRAHR